MHLHYIIIDAQQQQKAIQGEDDGLINEIDIKLILRALLMVMAEIKATLRR